MAKYEIITVANGTGSPPPEYEFVETVNLGDKSVRNTTDSEINDLLSKSVRKFILKSDRGWQYKTIKFVADKGPLSNVYPTMSTDQIDALIAASSVRERTTPHLMSVDDAIATLEARKHASSPFRPRRKDSPKRGKKVDKKSGKLRKNKRSKKLRV
jgi:hypothetical protein